MTNSIDELMSFDQDAHSFVIRIWREPSNEKTAGIVRGWIEHAQSKERQYFQDVDSIVEFVAHHVEPDEAEGQGKGESSERSD